MNRRSIFRSTIHSANTRVLLSNFSFFAPSFINCFHSRLLNPSLRVNRTWSGEKRVYYGGTREGWDGWMWMDGLGLYTGDPSPSLSCVHLSPLHPIDSEGSHSLLSFQPPEITQLEEINFLFLLSSPSSYFPHELLLTNWEYLFPLSLLTLAHDIVTRALDLWSLRPLQPLQQPWAMITSRKLSSSSTNWPKMGRITLKSENLDTTHVAYWF